jgi:hypothetical protein
VATICGAASSAEHRDPPSAASSRSLRPRDLQADPEQRREQRDRDRERRRQKQESVDDAEQRDPPPNGRGPHSAQSTHG